MRHFPKFDDYLSEEEANLKINRELLKFSSKLIHEKYGELIKDMSDLHEFTLKRQGTNEDLPLKFLDENKAIYHDILHK